MTIDGHPNRADAVGIDETVLRAAYQAEAAGVLRRRLPLTACLFLLFIGIVVIAESLDHPARRRTVVVFYVVEALACLAAVGAGTLRHPPFGPRAIAAALACLLAALMSAYNAVVGGELERLLMAHITWLSGLVVLLPWGWQAQLAAAIGSVTSFSLAVPHLSTNVPLLFPLLALANAVITSVCGAFFLDRSRYDAFVQTTRWQRASAAKQEEADISTALLHVADALSTHLDQPDMLERVNRLAVETLGCDWSSTFVWDDLRQVFRLHANVGSRPEVVSALDQVEFPRDSLPLLLALRPGELIEIADAEHQSLVPVELMRRTQTASALYAPISRGEAVIGTLVNGYRGRTGSFSSKQRRLALGIAHATAVALENARLIANLQAASRLKSEFVSTMSHELRTPLNVILGYAEMARDASFAATERDEHLARIETAGHELLDLIQSTLDIGRIEAGRDELRLQPVGLAELWKTAGEHAQQLPRSPGVALEWIGAAPPVSLVTDPHKLTTVIRNLVGNALKFTERGRVRADACVDGEAIVITVSDTGVGIAPGDQAAIFDMFRQTDGSDSRRYGGVGLGLYIVRRFVEQLGGAVEVRSAPGHGSTFTVRLPLAA